MGDRLKDVGIHIGTWSNGHYEAHIGNDGNVVITTLFESAKHEYHVSLSLREWDRLVAWVEWQRKKDL
jgi:hypothetical protein